jgi:hypothetical protein
MDTKLPDPSDDFVAGDPSLPKDPVIEFYKAKVDLEKLRENLKLTPEERLVRLMERIRQAEEQGTKKDGCSSD